MSTCSFRNPDNKPGLYDGGGCLIEWPPSQDLRGEEEPALGSTEEDAELGVNLAFSRNWRKVRVVGGTRGEQ